MKHSPLAGFVKLPRQLFFSDLWLRKPRWWVRVWLYILQGVEWRPDAPAHRGVGHFTVKEIHRMCRLDEVPVRPSTVRNVLAWLRRHQWVLSRKSQNGVYLGVVGVCDAQAFTRRSGYSLAGCRRADSQSTRTPCPYTQERTTNANPVDAPSPQTPSPTHQTPPPHRYDPTLQALLAQPWDAPTTE